MLNRFGTSLVVAFPSDGKKDLGTRAKAKPMTWCPRPRTHITPKMRWKLETLSK